MVPWRGGDCGCRRGGRSGGGCGGRGGVAVDDGAVAAVHLVVVVADEEDVVEERRGGTEGAGLAERWAAVHALHNRIDDAREHFKPLKLQDHGMLFSFDLSFGGGFLAIQNARILVIDRASPW